MAAGFIWSIVLFFAAVFFRERQQEEGFSWALAGAAIFFLTFCDRLPGHWTGPRRVLELLPGASHSDAQFRSAGVVIVILLVVYLLRVAVFYRLFFRGGQAIEPDDDAEVVNDYVAPVLSYGCFAICATALISPLYSLGPILTSLLAAALILEFFVPILSRLAHHLSDLAKLVVIGLGNARLAIGRSLVLFVKWTANFAGWRRADVGNAMSAWADRKLAATEKRLATAGPEGDRVIHQVAEHLRIQRKMRNRRDGSNQSKSKSDRKRTSVQ
ncbi:MAG: hypothetical protein WBV85_11845 [Solirubrobacteraceae bacterium]